MNDIDLAELRRLYLAGENVIEYLRRQSEVPAESSQIIELAYDLQAGSYRKNTERNLGKALNQTREFAQFIGRYISPKQSLLDVGSGELTSLTLILNHLERIVENVYAVDVSWSRLWQGRKFFNQYIHRKDQSVNTVSSNMMKLPFPTKSIDVTISTHALEPNRGHLNSILLELYRVTRSYCVFFEPSYERNSERGRRRMDKHGYIRGLEESISSLGGELLDVNPIVNVWNELNPTHCYIVRLPETELTAEAWSDKLLTVPGTDKRVVKKDGFLYSAETGLAFPILRDIPILKQESGVLATCLSDEN
jgi:ubiquinone/menaquinone biosynthesis C-methylase UbiE